MDFPVDTPVLPACTCPGPRISAVTKLDSEPLGRPRRQLNQDRYLKPQGIFSGSSYGDLLELPRVRKCPFRIQ